MSVVYSLLFAAATVAHPAPPQLLPIAFNRTFSNYAVLQSAPAKTAVYGLAGTPKNGSSWADQQISVVMTGGSKPVQGKVTLDPVHGHWIAYFPPQPVGGDLTITATCASGCANTTAAAIEHITFGDVWYCAGQSNMWLPMRFTYSRNYTVANITAGKYDNIRLMAGDSQHRNMYPWQTAKQAISKGNASVPNYDLFQFSAACWYFAEVLTNELRAASKPVPPIGLISTAIGGSMIEQWLLNETMAKNCANLSLAQHNQGLYDKNVRPYLSMTVKGFLWYQGENDMHGVKGNSLAHTGYACAQEQLVSLFREKWSMVPGTTDPNAPFGIVAIPPSGTEGGPNLGAMNLAQTGSFGSLPSPTMPNTFIAETYDLNDPWGDKTCYGWKCCWNNYNKSACTANAMRQKLPSNVCVNYCQQLQGTQVYMGGIHPRSKYLVGRRLAVAAHAQVYGGSGPVSGPVLAGCSVSGSKVTVRFDSTLMRGDKIVVHPYNLTAGLSGAAVLTNASWFCMEPALRCQINASGIRPSRCASPLQEWFCTDKHKTTRYPPGATPHTLQGTPPRNPYTNNWVVASVTVGAKPNELVIQAPAATQGAQVVGVKYAWDMPHACCNDGDPRIGKVYGCRLEACPVMTTPTNLPPNPFMVRVEDGKCKCIAPMVCDH